MSHPSCTTTTTISLEEVLTHYGGASSSSSLDDDTIRGIHADCRGSWQDVCEQLTMLTGIPPPPVITEKERRERHEERRAARERERRAALGTMNVELDLDSVQRKLGMFGLWSCLRSCPDCSMLPRKINDCLIALLDHYGAGDKFPPTLLITLQWSMSVQLTEPLALPIVQSTFESQCPVWPTLSLSPSSGTFSDEEVITLGYLSHNKPALGFQMRSCTTSRFMFIYGLVRGGHLSAVRTMLASLAECEAETVARAMCQSLTVTPQSMPISYTPQRSGVALPGIVHALRSGNKRLVLHLLDGTVSYPPVSGSGDDSYSSSAGAAPQTCRDGALTETLIVDAVNNQQPEIAKTLLNRQLVVASGQLGRELLNNSIRATLAMRPTTELKRRRLEGMIGFVDYLVKEFHVDRIPGTVLTLNAALDIACGADQDDQQLEHFFASPPWPAYEERSELQTPNHGQPEPSKDQIQVDLAKRLRLHGARVGPRSYAIYFAAKTGAYAVLKEILSWSDSELTSSELGFTPLYTCAFFDARDALPTLLKTNPILFFEPCPGGYTPSTSKDRRDWSPGVHAGKSPLDILVARNHLDALKLCCDVLDAAELLPVNFREEVSARMKSVLLRKPSPLHIAVTELGFSSTSDKEEVKIEKAKACISMIDLLIDRFHDKSTSIVDLLKAPDHSGCTVFGLANSGHHCHKSLPVALLEKSGTNLADLVS